ncbi:MAG: hypothetical protein ACR2ND_15480 [Solirubrobacteraceae bacterium]
MSEVEVISVRAPSLEKLEKEIARLLAGRPADDVLGLSHSSATTSSKQSGGIWGGAKQTHKVEYSALVVVRSA